MIDFMGLTRPALAPTKNEIIKASWNTVESSISNIGFEFCFYCYMTSDRSSIEAITTKNAIAWADYYMSTNYAKHDPIGKAAFKKEILIWNSTDEKDKIIRKIMNERRDYGMKSGITIPIINRFGNLTSWLSLSTMNSQKYLNSTISDTQFNENVYDIHIRTVSHALSQMTGIKFNICYAIVLSHYTNKVSLISQKTGFLVDDLYKLFALYYLDYDNIDLSGLDIKENSVIYVKKLSSLLNENSSLKYNFSKRQLECIQLIKRGLTIKHGAKELGISPRTYEGHANEIRQKLCCSNLKELMFKLSNFNIQ